MTDSALRARTIVDELYKCGITHIIYLPDNGTKDIMEIISSEERITIIPVCREGEAPAIAAGLITGGKQPVILIQCTGFFESGDTMQGVVLNMKLPFLFLIGYRGWKKNEPLTDMAAIYIEPILKAWGMKYYLLETVEDAEKISAAYREAQDESKPVAILITYILDVEWK
ncbi:hypothetical protein ACFLXU_07655 [Chloroflexota bacterium]